MRLTINPMMDIETCTWTGARIEWTGCVVSLKGDKTAQAAETNQNSFDQQLESSFQQQYGNQTSTLNYLKGITQSQISQGGTGYAPDALASMRTQASDTIAANGANARQAAMEGISARSGGSKLAGAAGTTAQVLGAIDSNTAAQDSSAQNQITMSNANLKNANYWNSISALNGTAAEADPLGYAGAANSGSGETADLSQANTQADGPGIGQILGSVLGGVGGALAGKIPIK